MEPVRVLFVCLGNICRSPMAEGLFADQVERSGLSDRFVIDSAGTSGHHAGERADGRMRATASGHGIALTTLARQLRTQDFGTFDFILTMDRSVHRDVLQLKATRPGGKAEVILMRDFDADADTLDVPDPYYGGAAGFEEVYQILLRSTAAFLAHLREGRGF